MTVQSSTCFNSFTTPINRSLVHRAVKRAMDISGSFIGLAILLLPLALVALAIKLDSKGPVFFR
ncbi:MAG: sugar transferase, partial [Dehalococcoidia bacterium]